MARASLRVSHRLIALAAFAVAGLSPASLAWEHEAESCAACKAARARLLMAGSRGFDPATGADLRNFAPDRVVDFQSLRLGITIPDMEERRLRGRASYVFAPVAEPVETLTLDARQMAIGQISGSPTLAEIADAPRVVGHSYDGEHLTVRFDPPIPADLTYTLTIDYLVDDPVDGLFWLTSDDGGPGPEPQIHTQGQPETNSYWFPTHDFPNERLTTELIVTVPEGYMVSANGELIERTDGPMRVAGGLHGGASFPHSTGDLPANIETWRYALNGDHPAYLVTLIVGKFAVVDVAPESAAVRMPVYVPAGMEEAAKATYARTHAMLEVFEDRFDEPYPWGERYAQLLVWNFGAGGMENTGATTMFATAAYDAIALAEGDLDGLIAHEFAHQWFGDLITCESWAHIWLNEGWATYSEALWFEARDGYHAGYLHDLYPAMRSLAQRDQLDPDSTGPARPGMVSRVYRHPWEVFRRVSNPYPKGAATLHMLRVQLGDELFFRAVREYVDRFRNDTVETHDFREVLEDVSGRSLDRFFDQWTRRPGTPNLHVAARWDETSRTLLITVEQKQRIDAEHPAFVFDLPLEIDGERHVVPMSERRHELRLRYDERPKSVMVDPYLEVLMHYTLDVWDNSLYVQTEHDSYGAQREAVRVMGDGSPTDAKVLALGSIMVIDDYHHAVREEAARSLGRLGATRDILTNPTAGATQGRRVLMDGIADPRVRAAAIEAAGEAGVASDLARDVLLLHASEEERSYDSRSAALLALAKLFPEEESTLEAITAALDSQSQNEEVLRAALEALERVDRAEGLALAGAHVGPKHLSRTRARALQTIGGLAHHDVDEALRVLEVQMRGRVGRVVRAAVDATSTIEDQRAVAAIDRFITRTRHSDWKQLAQDERDDLAARLRTGSGTDLGPELERMRREIEELRREVESGDEGVAG